MEYYDHDILEKEVSTDFLCSLFSVISCWQDAEGLQKAAEDSQMAHRGCRRLAERTQKDAEGQKRMQKDTEGCRKSQKDAEGHRRV